MVNDLCHLPGYPKIVRILLLMEIQFQREFENEVLSDPIVCVVPLMSTL